MQSLVLSILLLVGLMCHNVLSSNDENPPVVTTSQGRIIGTRIEFNATDPKLRRSVDAYLGIPYGEAPVGPLRFKPPVAKSWSGEIQATTLGNRCLQPTVAVGNDLMSGPIDEDCLVLDVMVPQPTPLNAAVLVSIHGGGYTVGAGIISEVYPTAIPAVGDVILVTMNYRLGALGFLSTNDDVIPGNVGLLDQRLALKWVRDNIEAFGGDPEKVAIFGQSVGASSVGLHMLSPGSAGLFRGAMLQSGDGAASWATAPASSAKTKAFAIGKLVGCERKTSQELLECLQNVEDGNLFVQNQQEKLIEALETSEMITFAPVVDGDFLPAEPSELYEKGAINDAVSIIGSLADEGMIMIMLANPNNTGQAPSFDSATFDAVAGFQLSWLLKSDPGLLTQIAKVMYGNASCIGSPNCDYLDALSQTIGDVMFVCPGDKTARAFAKAGRQVYRYHIEHIATTSFIGTSWTKATHSDDLVFLFGLPLVPSANRTYTEEEARMSIQIINFWANLAKTGDPNLSSTDAKLTDEEKESEWPVFNLEELSYKELSPNMKNKRAIKAKECLFWNEVAPKIRKLSEEANECKSSSGDEQGTCTKESCPEE